MSKQPWALVLGASSGFGEATALELARAGMHIFGVHLDGRNRADHVADLQDRIRQLGREVEFFNCNAADDERRNDCIARMSARLHEPEGTLRVILHSLPMGTLLALAGAQQVANRYQIELTIDVMGHSLVYWVQACLREGMLDKGARIFAMTRDARVMPQFGPISAAKAVLESHIRQLAVELAPAGITANAILPGVADTPALRQIPGFEKIAEAAKLRNPHRRLTQPEDVARCIAALCHPATYWLTGNVLHVDGGENIVA